MKEKYKILIVEDDEEVSSTLKDNLETEGYTVEVTQGELDAISKIKKDKYHVVLSDINMPKLDGIKLLREIKEYDAMTQVIMMTSNSSMDNIFTSLELGANDYILKPFESVEYVIKVIEYSVEKLERWRKAIIQLIK